MNFENIPQTVFSWTPTVQLYLPLHLLRVFMGFLLLSAPFCSSVSSVSLLYSHPSTHTSAVICATYFPLAPLPLPHLPSSRYSDTSRKPKLLSPLVDWYDGSKESKVNGKIINFPYVGKIRKFDSTGFISRFWKATCRLFTYSAYNSYLLICFLILNNFYSIFIIFLFLKLSFVPPITLWSPSSYAISFFPPNSLHFKLHSFLWDARKRRRKTWGLSLPNLSSSGLVAEKDFLNLCYRILWHTW